MSSRVPPIATDVALAVLFVAVNSFEVLHGTDDGVTAGGTVANLVVLDLFAALLVLRRRAPLLCWALMHAEFVLSGLLVEHSGFAWGNSLPSCIAAYTVARHGPRRWAPVALASGPLLWLGALLADGWTPKLGTGLGFFVVSTVAACGTGWLLRRLHERDEQVQQAHERLLQERQAREEAAVREERHRIALEMHEVVVVAVTAMVTRLDHEIRTLGAAGDDVRRLAAAEQAGRQALLELARTVGVLRAPESPTQASPTGRPEETAQELPSLADAPRLVEHYREAGLDVHWHTDPVDALPPGVSFAAYRILQEALTNAFKHGTGQVEVGLAVTGTGVELRVRNDLAPVLGSHVSGRHGLVGMRERVSAFGGSLHAGLSEDRFEVRATLPVPLTAEVGS